MPNDRMQRQRFEQKYMLDENQACSVRNEARITPTFGTKLENPCEPFGDRVILELKFTDRFPDWCRHLVERFGLMQCGAAKYCEGLAGLPEFGLGHTGDFRESPVVNEQVLLPMRPPVARPTSPQAARSVGQPAYA